MSIQILIADDHGVMRAGLRSLLEDEPAIEVVGEAESGVEAVSLARELAPDLVLMDIGLPDIDGIEATRRLRKQAPEARVLILSMYEDESLLHEAVRAGASGYMIKRAAEADLIAAIRAVAQGYMYVHPAITHLLVKDLSPVSRAKEGALDTLTPREAEVMGFLVKGFTNRQIAEALVISERTVEGHRANLFGKLGLKNRVELVEFAEKHGLRGTAARG